MAGADRAWLATTATLQGTFRKLLEDTVEGVGDLYRAFGPERSGPGRLSSAAATVVADITVPILTEKSEHRLQLQELLLEMAANAFRYQRDT